MEIKDIELLAEAKRMLREGAEEVFSAMFAMTVEDVPTDQVQGLAGPSVTGVIGFNGDFSGLISVTVSDRFARKLAATMLAMNEAEIEGEEMVNDVIGELSNMVAGTTKSRLCLDGSHCALTVPSIIRGKEVNTSPVSGSEQGSVNLWVRPNQILLTVQIRKQKETFTSQTA